MRLYTSLSEQQVHSALNRVKAAGLATPDIVFTASFATRPSRTHARSVQVQLGTLDKHSLPPGTRDQHGKVLRVRRYKNSGNRGAASERARGEAVWAATWHEWGWFMAEIFAADPGARFGAATGPSWGYRDAADFHEKTGNQFSELPSVPDRCQCSSRVAPECLANGRSCAPLMRVPRRQPLRPSPEQQERPWHGLTEEQAREARAAIAEVRETLASGHQPQAWSAIDQADWEANRAALSAHGDPDYVSPELRRAREQLKENEKLFTDRWDDTVFGPAY